MKTKEEVKKLNALDEKKLLEEAKKARKNVQTLKLEIASSKSTAYDKVRKARKNLARIITIINQRKNQDNG